MKDTLELPELPPSQMNVEVWDSEVQGLHQANAPYFTADQMRAYATAAVLAERERCARICDAVEVLQETDHGAANTGGASQCASAIRNKE